VDTRKAYGVVTALGNELGARAKTDDTLLRSLRATTEAAATRAFLTEQAPPRLPAAVLTAFLDETMTPDGWKTWRARILVQAKMVRDGGSPAAGHEGGGGPGVGRP